MNKKLRISILGVFIVALLMGGAVALAAVGTKTLNATYRDIKLVVDGKEVTPKDVNGNVVEPFIVDGTTYIPVRAAAQALGKDVVWDPVTNTVNVGDPGSAPAGPVEVKTYKIGVSIYRYDDYFMSLYRDELESYFKTLESSFVKYDVTFMDARGDMAEQTKQVDDFIAKKVDVMIINLVQYSSANTITAKAKAANIPCVYINREPREADIKAWDKVVYVGADARQAGTCQGEIIRDLPDHGDIDGDGVVRYVMLVGDPEIIDAQYRTEYSIKALTDAGIEVDALFVQLGYWDTEKGRELTAYALALHGVKVDVVFANNDGMAMGAIQAIKEAGRTVGRDIYLVGVDAIPEAIDAIRDGDMTGTVLNDHIGQSHAAVNAALVYLAGGIIDSPYLWVNYIKVA